MQKAVEITNDGHILRGMIHIPNSNYKVPLAILYHGFMGNRIEAHRIFVKLSRRLETVGIASMRFDFYGNGESDGDFLDTTFTKEISDAKAILNYGISLNFVDAENIYLVGLSLGGAIASIVSSYEKHKVKKLVLWSASDNRVRVAENIINNYKAKLDSQNYIDFGGMLWSKDFIYDILKYNIYEISKNFSKDVLIIHGEKDTIAPILSAYKYKEIYGDKADLHIIKDADHTFSKKEWEEDAINTTVDFLYAK